MQAVLIPLEKSWIYDNPFVGTILDELVKYRDIEVHTGVDKFWDEEKNWDIVHIYWPQCLLQGAFDNKTTTELYSRILGLKANGSTIISTCLNFSAHYSKDTRLNESYDLVYSLSDIIIHLAEYSKKILDYKYPLIKSTVIEHHVYDSLYTSTPSKQLAYKKLKLRKKDKYILSFGTYRSDEEREFIFKVAKEVYKRTKYKFLIPTLYPLYGKESYKVFLLKIYYKLKMCGKHYIIYGHKYVDNLLPYYYAATDVSFIQRIKILNSGNVPMGFFWKHVVVGTQEACVGEILKKMGNPTFDYSRIDSVIAAVESAILLSQTGKGNSNKTYVINNCTVSKTVDKIYRLYQNNLKHL